MSNLIEECRESPALGAVAIACVVVTVAWAALIAHALLPVVLP